MPIPGFLATGPRQIQVPQPPLAATPSQVYLATSPFQWADGGANAPALNVKTVNAGLSKPINQGDLLVAVAAASAQPIANLSISDTSGNAWQLITTTEPTNVTSAMYCCLAAGAAPGGVTVTLTCTSGTHLGLVVDRFTVTPGLSASLGGYTWTAPGSVTSGNAGTINSDPGNTLLYGGNGSAGGNATVYRPGSSNGAQAVIRSSYSTSAGVQVAGQFITPTAAGPQSLTWSASAAIGPSGVAYQVQFFAAVSSPAPAPVPGFGYWAQRTPVQQSPVKPSSITNLLTLGGTVNVTGSMSQQTGKNLSGTVNVTGTLTRSIGKILAGTVNVTGTLVMSTGRLLAATVNVAGSVTRSAGKILPGTVNITGALTRQAGKILAGTVNVTGTLAAGRARVLTLAAAVNVTGSLTRSAGKVLSGTVNVTGTAVRSLGKVLAGTVSVTGKLVTQAIKTGSAIIFRLGSPRRR